MSNFNGALKNEINQLQSNFGYQQSQISYLTNTINKLYGFVNYMSSVCCSRIATGGVTHSGISKQKTIKVKEGNFDYLKSIVVSGETYGNELWGTIWWKWYMSGSDAHKIITTSKTQSFSHTNVINQKDTFWKVSAVTYSGSTPQEYIDTWGTNKYPIEFHMLWGDIVYPDSSVKTPNGTVFMPISKDKAITILPKYKPTPTMIKYEQQRQERIDEINNDWRLTEYEKQKMIQKLYA